MGVPRALLPNERITPNGRDFLSEDRTAIFAIRRFNSASQIESVFEGLKADLSSTKIKYAVSRATWFVVSGDKDGYSYYFRFFRTNLGYEGFYAAYDTVRSSLFSPPVVLTSLTFQTSPEPRTQPSNVSSYRTIPIEDQLRNILFKEPAADRTSAIPPVGLPSSPSQSGMSPAVRRPETSPPDKANAAPTKPVNPETSRLLLDSIEVLIKRSAATGTRIYRYSVDKTLLPNFSDSMPLLKIVFEEKIFFNTDKSELRPDAVSMLDTVAATLQRTSGRLVLFVAGHTDSRGSDEYNVELSDRRAQSVARYLTTKGVGTAAIWRVGFGKSVPIRPNNSIGNMALNRRVQFLLASQPEVVAAWIKDPKGICEEGIAENCGVLRESNTFVAIQMSQSGPKQINLDLPPIKPQEIEIIIQPVEVGAPLQ